MNINLYTWFVKRQLDFLPNHSVPTVTPVNDERHMWILEKCNGRYHIGPAQHKQKENDWLALFGEYVVYFEDPQEAVLYELTWS